MGWCIPAAWVLKDFWSSPWAVAKDWDRTPNSLCLYTLGDGTQHFRGWYPTSTLPGCSPLSYHRPLISHLIKIATYLHSARHHCTGWSATIHKHCLLTSLFPTTHLKPCQINLLKLTSDWVIPLLMSSSLLPAFYFLYSKVKTCTLAYKRFYSLISTYFFKSFSTTLHKPCIPGKVNYLRVLTFKGYF